MPALLEEARCRRQALLRVDVVDNHDAIAGFDARLEHSAVGHHRLAIETGQRGNGRMRSRGDDAPGSARSLRTRPVPEPAWRSAPGPHLELALDERDTVTAHRHDARRLESGNTRAHDDDAL